jgi:hypothetical protein
MRISCDSHGIAACVSGLAAALTMQLAGVCEQLLSHKMNRVSTSESLGDREKSIGKGGIGNKRRIIWR